MALWYTGSDFSLLRVNGCAGERVGGEKGRELQHQCELIITSQRNVGVPWHAEVASSGGCWRCPGSEGLFQAAAHFMKEWPCTREHARSGFRLICTCRCHSCRSSCPCDSLGTRVRTSHHAQQILACGSKRKVVVERRETEEEQGERKGREGKQCIGK